MKHIAFLSFGKDSLAQIIKIKQLELPLDEVVYVDIRYTHNISGEHPKMAEWIPTAEKILKSQLGVTVKHITAKIPFKEYFYQQKKKGKHIGDIYGFPYTLGAWCNSRLKLDVISQYVNSLNDNVTEYVGIAYDEPNRYDRLIAKNTKTITYRSILFENKITEKTAFEICREHALVSPFYNEGGFRGGCWFCVKQCMADLYELWLKYPTLFAELVLLQKDSFNKFKPDCSIAELENKFINGYVPTRRKTSNAK